mgnify:FL=1
MNQPRRVENQPAFVLHHYPYRETSQIIEVFTRHHGRVAMVARGTRRPKSVLRGVLLAFQPLLLSWFGKNELKTLHAAEWQGGVPQLTGLPLMCGFYLNELLLHLLPRDDPHEALFADYYQAIRGLAAGGEVAPVLRRFELQLLQSLGYGVELTRVADSGVRVEAGAHYQFLLQHGLVCVESGTDGALSGATLLNMASGLYPDAETLQQSKQLMRQLLGHYLGERQLYTRQLLRDLNQL